MKIQIATYGASPTVDANTVAPPAPSVQPDGDGL